jgi:hypothetical protein
VIRGRAGDRDQRLREKHDPGDLSGRRRQVQGTIGVDPSSVYTGELLAVVYDPSSPSVVSLASDVGDTSSAWAETITGAIFLLLIPLSFLLAVAGRRRRRRRAINAALGD